MTFEQEPIAHLLRECVQINPEGGPRFYRCGFEESEYPSITSRLNDWPGKQEALRKWREREPNWKSIMEHSASVGSIVHDAAERYLLGLEDLWSTESASEYPQGVEEAQKRFNQIKIKIDKHVTAVLGTELAVYCDALQTAGTFDALVRWRFEGGYEPLVILDFKNKRKRPKQFDVTRDGVEYWPMDDYWCQMWFYKNALTENLGEQIHVVDGINISSYPTPTRHSANIAEWPLSGDPKIRDPIGGGMTFSQFLKSA